MTPYISKRRWLCLSEIVPDVEPECERGRYALCERDIISPALRAAGYTLTSGWFTGDGDSFGPLTRCVETDRGTVVYG